MNKYILIIMIVVVLGNCTDLFKFNPFPLSLLLIMKLVESQFFSFHVL